MGTTMDWSNFSTNDPLRHVMSLLDDAVSSYRNRGHSRQHAVEQAALALGITPRRAKSLLYGEAFTVAVEEYRAIKARFLDHLDAEAEHLAARSAAARARRRQMELEIA